MIMSLSKHTCSTLIVAFFLIGCSAPEPYVWRPYTIDRAHVDFPDGPALSNGSRFSICYVKSGTTPTELQQIADEECGRFGLKSRFAKQNHDLCPLVTPVAAQFACVGEPEQIDKTTVDQQRPGSLFQDSGSSGASGSILPPSASTFNAEDVSTTAKSAPYPTFLFNGAKTRP